VAGPQAASITASKTKLVKKRGDFISLLSIIKIKSLCSTKSLPNYYTSTLRIVHMLSFDGLNDLRYTSGASLGSFSSLQSAGQCLD
jgi:hypothetical protein